MDGHSRPRVVIVLPAPMIARNWLSTSVLESLAKHRHIDFTVITSEDGDKQKAEDTGLRWRQMLRGSATRGITRIRYYGGYVLHLILMHRFNAIVGFRGSRERIKQSWKLRKIAFKDGLPASRWFGWPFANARWLFSVLQSIYHSSFQRYRAVEELFSDLQPSLLVLGHVQNHFTTPYALAAMNRNVPIVGAIGSWDQPTTKGPLNPGVGRYLVQSKGVAAELARYHGVTLDWIEIVGWPQMDLYGRGSFEKPRRELLADLGLPSHFKYVLMGAYPERLGRHEPDLCVQLADRLMHRDCALVIRCHPIDKNWRARFGGLHRPPHVIVVSPELGHIERMANQIRHAEVVLSSAGTILLDAIALDTPVVGIALEDEQEPYYDRVARRYDMEHWAALVETGGLPLARSEKDLFSLVEASLADKGAYADGRARLRAEHLDPLDGRSAERLVAAIVRAVDDAATSLANRSQTS